MTKEQRRIAIGMLTDEARDLRYMANGWKRAGSRANALIVARNSRALFAAVRALKACKVKEGKR